MASPLSPISSNWRIPVSGFLNWSNCLCFWSPCCVTCPLATMTLLPLSSWRRGFSCFWSLLVLSLCFRPRLLQCLGSAPGVCLCYITVPFIGAAEFAEVEFFYFLLLSFCFLAHTCVFLTYFSSYFFLAGSLMVRDMKSISSTSVNSILCSNQSYPFSPYWVK